jgi:3-hydroxy-9,10-secoandrosta-1,3,5(10)-triene-9,17-dione monooxygenase
VIPLPEPDLTPQTVIERARALIPAVRAQQDEAERLGHHTAELGRQFTEAGFYRILQPRQFGGYAFGLPTFWRVMLAISAGDPGTGWALTLGAHHVLTIGAWFCEAGQRDIFGSSGEFAAPHRALPSGTAEPADGGYLVSGTWDYCSGSAYATHFMCNAMVAGTTDRITAVMPMGQVTVLDDWG